MILNQAPMEGVVDYCMRRLLSEIGGIDRYVTEFVRVTDQLLPKKTFIKYCPELETGGRTFEGTPVYLQLLGGKPNWLGLNAKAAVEAGALGIDLNFGCPAKTVNRHDGGAALLKMPSRLFECVDQVKQNVSVPVTAKVRLGFEHKDFHLEIASEVERGGASELTVHARTKLEGYKPPAHWEYIKYMRQHIKIPVIANGEIWSIDDFSRCQSVTGCERFALGRGLVAQPSLARELRGGKKVDWDEMVLMLQKFATFSKEFRHEHFAVTRVKQWTKLLSRNFLEAKIVFEKIKRSESLIELTKSLETCHEPNSYGLHLEQLPILHSSQESFKEQKYSV